MADAFIQVAPDSTGKKMQTFRNTIAGSDVDAEAVVLTDSTGIALGTSGGALNVYLANSVINANINTALLATSAHQTSGDQKTQIVDGLGNVIGSTSNALNVYLASITANAGTNLNTVGLATAAAQTNGGQKTLVVDPINASNAAGVTNGALNVYLPSITANAGTNLNTVGLALAVTQTNGGQKTQIVDPINASNVAGITNGALNVYLPSITVNAGTNLNTSLLATSIKQSDGTQKSQVVDGSGNVIGATANALDVNVKSSTSLTVTGPLTDTQLRASAVPVSLAIAPTTIVQLATATLVSSTGYENAHVLKNAAGRLISLQGYNSKTVAQFIQLFDKTSVPLDGTIPVMTFTVPKQSNFSFDIPMGAMPFANGIVVCNSSTATTKQIGSADCFFTAMVI
jgi:hypothetical protein